MATIRRVGSATHTPSAAGAVQPSGPAVKQAVMAGLGIAFLSAHAVALELEVGRLVTLDVRGFPHTENWHIVHHRDKRLPPVARAFKEFLRKDGARIIESVTHIPSRPVKAGAAKRLASRS